MYYQGVASLESMGIWRFVLPLNDYLKDFCFYLLTQDGLKF